MTISIESLEYGDVVEIKYQVWRKADDGGERIVERWVSGSVCHCERGTRPIARLADGQMTEIRSFMNWRLITRARSRRPLAA
jgi:hypothetical protein